MKPILYWLLVFFGVVAFFLGDVLGGESGQEVETVPFHCQIVFQQTPRIAAPTSILIKYSPAFRQFDSLKVTLAAEGGLTFSGDTSWHAVFTDTMSQAHFFIITIPPNDTSAIFVQLESRGLKWPFGRYFVTTHDSIEMYNYRPVDRDLNRGYRKFIEENYPPGGHWIKIDSSIYDSAYVLPPESMSHDTSYSGQLTQEEIYQREQKKKEQLELSPETTYTARCIIVGGETWIRNKGETKFRKSVGITDRRAHHKAVSDSIVKANANEFYDTWMDLRDTANLAFARTVIDSLQPTELPGIYHARIKLDVLEQLGKRGIEAHPWRGKAKLETIREMRQKSKEINFEPARTRESPTGTASPASQLFYESFEGSFPGTKWTVGSNYNSSHYWGKSKCDSWTGTWSAWCDGNSYNDCAYFRARQVSYLPVQIVGSRRSTSSSS